MHSSIWVYGYKKSLSQRRCCVPYKANKSLCRSSAVIYITSTYTYAHGPFCIYLFSKKLQTFNMQDVHDDQNHHCHPKNIFPIIEKIDSQQQWTNGIFKDFFVIYMKHDPFSSMHYAHIFKQHHKIVQRKPDRLKSLKSLRKSNKRWVFWGFFLLFFSSMFVRIV